MKKNQILVILKKTLLLLSILAITHSTLAQNVEEVSIQSDQELSTESADQKSELKFNDLILTSETDRDSLQKNLQIREPGSLLREKRNILIKIE